MLLIIFGCHIDCILIYGSLAVYTACVQSLLSGSCDNAAGLSYELERLNYSKVVNYFGQIVTMCIEPCTCHSMSTETGSSHGLLSLIFAALTSTVDRSLAVLRSM